MSNAYPKLLIKLHHVETDSEVSSNVVVATDRFAPHSNSTPEVGSTVWLQIHGGQQYVRPPAPQAPPLKVDMAVKMTSELHQAFGRKDGQPVEESVAQIIGAMLPRGFELKSVRADT